VAVYKGLSLIQKKGTTFSVYFLPILVTGSIYFIFKQLFQSNTDAHYYLQK